MYYIIAGATMILVLAVCVLCVRLGVELAKPKYYEIGKRNGKKLSQNNYITGYKQGLDDGYDMREIIGGVK